MGNPEDGVSGEEDGEDAILEEDEEADEDVDGDWGLVDFENNGLEDELDTPANVADEDEKRAFHPVLLDKVGGVNSD